MTAEAATVRAAVHPTPGAISALSPLTGSDVRVTGGFWAQRLRLGREQTIPHGFQQLERAGNLANLRLAAGVGEGPYRALGLMFSQPFPFLDSDVYKWLEAAGWELAKAPDAALARSADELIDAVAGAQRQDGYLNTFVQVMARGQEYRDLAWGHELYCIGHLIQAAIAWHRAAGDDRLMEVALRAVGSVERELGPDGRQGIDGHPEIEMALVELYRTTGERRHLELAARFIDLRGRGLLGADRFGAAYWQDHLPVRDAPTVAGHAVRQLYLDCGAVDVATELGDAALLEAVRRRWRDMVATRMYLTGGLGSRYRDEAFGDPFELPPDLAYAETCAAIASAMLAWRLLLATGDPDAADVIERTVLNGVLPSVALDGTRFFYVNPLQRRTHRRASEPHDGERADWYPCACCPPNVMRLLASWEQYLATVDGAGIQIHQYADADLAADLTGGRVRLAIETDYPWDGRVSVSVVETPERPWTLSLRVPAWCTSWSARVVDDERRGEDASERMIRETRPWHAGDSVVLDLAMPPRITQPHPRIDAVRGCVALERGPLVYCIETADLPAGMELEDVQLDASVEPEPVARSDVADPAIGLALPGGIGAIPYFAWGNRGPGAMRVWIPRASA